MPAKKKKPSTERSTNRHRPSDIADASSELEKPSSLFSNEGVIHAVLRELGLEFDKDTDRAGESVGIFKTTVPFISDKNSDNDDPSFMVILFSHEDRALLRAYSYLIKIDDAKDISHVLSVINKINYSHLLNGHLDFDESRNAIRFRAIYRESVESLPTKSTSEFLKNYFVAADEIARFTRIVSRMPHPYPESFDKAREEFKKQTNWNGAPFF